MDCNPPVSLSMGFSRKEYWSEFPCPPPGDLPDSEIEPMSPAAPALAREFFTTEINTGKPLILILSRGPQTFLAKSWIVNILGFSGNVVSVELI